MRYPHLKLERWPFRVVPERNLCTFIADRAQLRGDIEALVDGARHRDASAIRLFWAWFGAGKTHALYYLANRAAALQESDSLERIVPVYTEFPKSPRGFVDVYRAFVASLNIEALVDAFLEVSTSASSDPFLGQLAFSSPDLVSSLQVAATGKPQDRLVAMRWLRADSLPVGEFRRIGLSKGITTSEEAVTNLVALVNLFRVAAAAEGCTRCTVMWLLDEFQRIEKAVPRVRDEINAGLHSVFNACPSGLLLVLSFSGKPQKTLPDWFSAELGDRIGRTKVLVLPPMQPDEARAFVADVLKENRPNGAGSAPKMFPFAPDACDAIIDEVRSSGDVKPRALMQAFGAVLEEAEPKLRTGELDVVSADFAKKVLSEYVSVMEEEPDGS